MRIRDATRGRLTPLTTAGRFTDGTTITEASGASCIPMLNTELARGIGSIGLDLQSSLLPTNQDTERTPEPTTPIGTRPTLRRLNNHGEPCSSVGGALRVRGARGGCVVSWCLSASWREGRTLRTERTPRAEGPDESTCTIKEETSGWCDSGLHPRGVSRDMRDGGRVS